MPKYHIDLAYTHAAAIEFYRQYDLRDNYLFHTFTGSLASIDLDLKDRLKDITGNNILTYWGYSFEFYLGAFVIQCFLKYNENAELWVFVTEDKERE